MTYPDLRVRRERLKLSREKLAREADCSAVSIELLEGGWRPKRSRVLVAVVETLTRLELAAASSRAGFLTCASDIRD
jgi:predicted transcriptional regulator